VDLNTVGLGWARKPAQKSPKWLSNVTIGAIMLLLAAVFGGFFLGSGLVMLAWNAFLVTTFGMHPLGYAAALGLMFFICLVTLILGATRDKGGK
jgi:hypothetical protein